MMQPTPAARVLCGVALLLFFLAIGADVSARAPHADDALRSAAVQMEAIAAEWDAAQDEAHRAHATVVRTTRWSALGGDLTLPEFEVRDTYALRLDGGRFHYRLSDSETMRAGRHGLPQRRPTNFGGVSFEREVLGDGASLYLRFDYPQEIPPKNLVFKYADSAPSWTPDGLLHPWYDARSWSNTATWTETVDRQLANGSAEWVDETTIEVSVGVQRVVYRLGEPYDGPLATGDMVDVGNDAGGVIGAPIREMQVRHAETNSLLYAVEIDAVRGERGVLLPSRIVRRGTGVDGLFYVDISFRDWAVGLPTRPMVDDATNGGDVAPGVFDNFDMWALNVDAESRLIEIDGAGVPVRIFEVVEQDATEGGGDAGSDGDSRLDLEEIRRRGSR